jgi:hypothetical protein
LSETIKGAQQQNTTRFSQLKTVDKFKYLRRVPEKNDDDFSQIKTVDTLTYLVKNSRKER